MNYPKIYEQLIAKAQSRETTDLITEDHHILPSGLGGSDVPDNMVLLTLREHFVAHFMLAKVYGGKMWWAFNMMSNFQKYGSRHYSFLKGKMVMTDEHKSKIGKAHKGKIVSPVTCQKISNSKRGVPRPEVAVRMKTMTGEKNVMFGKTHDSEARQKIVDANRQIVECPFCKKSGGIAAMHRWHFKKCPNNPEGIPREVLKLRKCPHCDLEGRGFQMTRYHFENCRGRA